MRRYSMSQSGRGVQELVPCPSEEAGEPPWSGTRGSRERTAFGPGRPAPPDEADRLKDCVAGAQA